MIPQVIITIRDGVLESVVSNTEIEYVLVDWDNIDAGDEFPTEINSRADEITEGIENYLLSLNENKHRVKKVDTAFYWDWALKDDKIYVYQETPDGRVHTTFVCEANGWELNDIVEELFEDVSEDEEYIYITTKTRER